MLDIYENNDNIAYFIIGYVKFYQYNLGIKKKIVIILYFVKKKPILLTRLEYKIKITQIQQLYMMEIDENNAQFYFYQYIKRKTNFM